MSKIENRILTDLVYEKIKTLIIDEVLTPGTKINKKELAELLGVSQTPINDAVSRLAGEKYIDQISRQGFFVKTYTNEDLRDLFAVRAGLEGIAIRLCVESASDDALNRLTHCFDGFNPPLNPDDLKRYIEADKLFHERIVELSENAMIQEMDRSFGYVVKSYQKGLIRPPEDTYPEHVAIIQAVRDRDPFHAQELIIQHHLRSRSALMTKIAVFPEKR